MQTTEHLNLDVTINNVRRVFKVIYYKDGRQFGLRRPEGFALCIHLPKHAGKYHDMYNKEAAIALAHALVAEFTSMVHEAGGLELQADSAWEDDDDC